MDWKSAKLLVITLVPFLVVRNSKLFSTTFFSCFWSWIRLVADVSTIGGGLPVLLAVDSSHGEPSVVEDSVSISATRRGAKKFRVTTAFGGELTPVGDVLAGTLPLVPVVFLRTACCSSEGFRLRLLCSRNSSVDSLVQPAAAGFRRHLYDTTIQPFSGPTNLIDNSIRRLPACLPTHLL
jgi:hypothetical protein